MFTWPFQDRRLEMQTRTLVGHSQRLRSRRRGYRGRALFLEALETRNLLAGMPHLLKDINANASGSFPADFVQSGGVKVMAGLLIWNLESQIPNLKSEIPDHESMDLLSAVLHELGHELGFDHDDDVAAMFETLSVGTRRLPLREPSG